MISKTKKHEYSENQKETSISRAQRWLRLKSTASKDRRRKGASSKHSPSFGNRTSFSMPLAMTIPEESLFARIIMKQFTFEMMNKLLEGNELPADNEVDVCHMLVDWLEAMESIGQQIEERHRLLHHIRWPEISKQTFNKMFKQNPLFSWHNLSRIYLDEVAPCYETNVVSGEPRSLTASGKCLVIVESNQLDDNGSKFHCYNLQQPKCKGTQLPDIQSTIHDGAACCAEGNTMFIIGIGDTRAEIWKFDSREWTQCASMITGRCGHCVELVTGDVYILGGFDIQSLDVLDTVEIYSPERNVSESLKTNLCIAVEMAASVTYERCIYIFGGSSVDSDSDIVQKYDPIQKTCTILETKLPLARKFMKAFIWRHYAILLGIYNCFVYDFESQKWSQRDQYRTSVNYFGLAVDNDHVFVTGVTNNLKNSDTIASVPINDIIYDVQSQKWKPHTQLFIKDIISMCTSFDFQTERNQTFEWPYLAQSSFVLKFLPEESMISMIEDKDLPLKDEESVCHWIIKWFSSIKRSSHYSRYSIFTILTFIRWSVVDRNFIVSTFMTQPFYTENDYYGKIVSKALLYQSYDVHFRELKTFTRNSSKLTRCFVLIGIDTGSNTHSNVYRINLQNRKHASEIEILPVGIGPESAACVIQGTLYVIGIGGANKEIWNFRTTTGWRYCSKMIHGRRRHCLAFIDLNIFVIGGYDGQNVLDDIEKFNCHKYETRVVSRLCVPVMNAASAAYQTSVYIFGGCDNYDVRLDVVQIYNTDTHVCTLLEQPMLLPHRSLRIALWEDYAILAGCHSCFLYNFESNSWEERKQFKTGVHFFGLFIENQQIYSVGGEIEQGSCTNEIMCVPVIDLIENQGNAFWSHTAFLPFPCAVHAFGILNFPAESCKVRCDEKMQSKKFSRKPIVKNSPIQSEITQAYVKLPNCNICNGYYSDPRMLPCGHSFCLVCIQQLNEVSEAANSKMCCPLCMKEMPISKNEICNLPKNYALADFEYNDPCPEPASGDGVLESSSSQMKPENKSLNNYATELRHVGCIDLSVGKRISGISVVENRLYVVSEYKNVIEMFDIYIGTEYLPRLEFGELTSPKDIVSKIITKTRKVMLFVSDTKTVWRIIVSKNKITEWLINISSPHNLAITSNEKLIKITEDSEKWFLKLYETEGEQADCYQTIKLSNEIRHPTHVVENKYKHFIICYGTGSKGEDGRWSTWAISEVSQYGTILQTFHPQTLDGPIYYMTITENEIFVSDGGKKQIVIIDFKFTSEYILVPPSGRLNWSPWKICYSEKTNRLYVGNATKCIDIFQDTNESKEQRKSFDHTHL